ncbi:50S ribosomal protein L31e [Candidatus Bathyarchaeota archaeon]|nr:50S ribosomal protein L31e [Candidatus Bathyarchaeota archaeon]
MEKETETKTETKEQETEERKETEPTEEAVEEVEGAGDTLEKVEEVEEAEGALEKEEEVEEVPEEKVEEEVKPSPRKEVEEDIVEERIYTIPLGKAWIAKTRKRAPRAIKIIKVFVNRHMKLKAQTELEEEEEPNRLIISNEVNEKIWRRGIEKPPRRVRIRAAKDKDGNVTVYLAEGD